MCVFSVYCETFVTGLYLFIFYFYSFPNTFKGDKFLDFHLVEVLVCYSFLGEQYSLDHDWSKFKTTIKKILTNKHHEKMMKHMRSLYAVKVAKVLLPDQVLDSCSLMISFSDVACCM